MPLCTQLILTYVGCYLVGGTPFGYLAGRMRGMDVRELGSGNIGATNIARLLGRKWGVSVFLLDVCKGMIPTVAVGIWLSHGGVVEAWSSTGRQLAWLGGGLACVLGHSFPVYLGFRGGKGVATSLGVVLGIYPYLSAGGFLAFAVWGLVLSLTRIVSLASVVAAVSLPILVIACTLWGGYSEVGSQWPIIVFAFLIAGLILYRHRSNITRLRTGQERRIGEGPEGGENSV
ncbi:MAG: glycerol-3-phosphate 1-O-acyltransferase PlsY [Planctomycetes bacterium]|nr:glycerol-3-phosphate 1-O-acyltransferase PlsY [Planctomycetota bacterium]